MTAPTPIPCEGGCGRLLRTPDSIRRRIGPVCWEKANPTRGRGHSLRARRPKPVTPATGQLTLFEETTTMTTRFGLTVDNDNGHHVHFTVYSATGGQHLGRSGNLVMTSAEYQAFRQLLEPMLTDRPDPAPVPPLRPAVPQGPSGTTGMTTPAEIPPSYQTADATITNDLYDVHNTTHVGKPLTPDCAYCDAIAAAIRGLA